MKKENEQEHEITEEEAKQVDAGARTQRASEYDIRLTRRPDGTGGRLERRVRVDPE